MSWPKFIFILLALGAVAFAGDSRTIKLRVTDSFTHLPVAGAEVFLAEEAGEKAFRKVGVTGERSFFALELTNAAASCQVEIRAEGYDSHRSTRFSFAEGASFKDVALARLMDFEGVIIAPTGQRAGGARYFLCTDLTQVTFMPDRTFFTRSRMPETTGPSGKFRLSPESTGHAILVSHDLGFALRPLAGWTNGGAIQLQPWARVAGRLTMNGSAASNQLTALSPTFQLLNRTPAVFLEFNSLTGTNGSFSFSNVPPVAATLWRKRERKRPDGSSAWVPTHSCSFTAIPGESRELRIDFRGRDVTGRFVLEGAKRQAAIEFGVASLTRRGGDLPIEFSRAPGGVDPVENYFDMWVAEDGSFNGEIVPTGFFSVEAALDGVAWRGNVEVPEGLGKIDLGSVVLKRDSAPAK